MEPSIIGTIVVFVLLGIGAIVGVIVFVKLCTDEPCWRGLAQPVAARSAPVEVEQELYSSGQAVHPVTAAASNSEEILAAMRTPRDEPDGDASSAAATIERL